MADGSGLTPEERRMAEENMDLVRFIAGQEYPKVQHRMSLEDVLQEGYEGLVEAVRRFDPRRGYKLTTYARHRIRGAILNAYAREVQGEEQVIALAQEAGYDFQATQTRPGDVMLDMDGKAEERALNHGGCITAGMFARAMGAYKAATPEEALSMHRRFRRAGPALDGALAILPDRDRRTIEMHCFEGVPMEEIAKILEISEAGAYRQRTRILQRLKKLLALAHVEEMPPLEEEL